MFGLGLLSATLALSSPIQAVVEIDHSNYMRLLSPGINLGNTLEAIPTQTSWGNPVPNQALFHSIREAGFKSIRIPAAWSQYSDAAHNIDSKWMEHVVEVVDMARKAGLFVLLNIHWDGGWLQPTYADREKTEAKFRKFWQQIATRFRDHDHGLMFAGTNEVHVSGNYGAPTPENAEVQNGFNQIFVDVVRATGGRNADRTLAIQAYNTDIDHCLAVNMKMPNDTVKGRLMMEVHYYSPYHFTLNENSDIWQWGRDAADPKAKDTWGDEDYLEAQFRKMKEAFVDKGIPVILGEYCAMLKPRFPGSAEYRNRWDQAVTRAAVKSGLVPMYWDIGVDGLFDRATGKPREPARLKALVEAASP